MPPPIDVEIKVGSSSGAFRDLVASGAFVLDVNDNFFSLSIEDLRFDFELKFDVEIDGLKTHYDSPEDKVLRIHLINMNKSIAVSIRNKVGFMRGRDLYLGIFLQNLNQEEKQARLINFSFTLGAARAE